MKSTPFLVVFLSLMIPSAPAQRTQLQAAAPARKMTLQQMYDEAKLAYYLNDFAKAKPLLVRVNRADPNHRPTAIMLKNIELAEQDTARQAASLEGRMKRITLEKFEVEEAKVPEVLDFLQLKATEAGHAKPNFIVRLDDTTARQAVTLRLRRISLYDALRSLETAADLEIRYDTHAVTVLSHRATADIPVTGAGN